MKIDLHNYEEFLLLYIDGELTTEEMQMVNVFAKANPTVKAELDALQATKLMPEEISFLNKESLFKTQTNQEITTTNYQEKMLMYVDEALTDTEKTALEKYVLHNPNIQDEFTLLKQTKLVAEVMACPNKEDLYKKERRIAPIFYIARIAVAAVFVGLIGFAYLLLTKKENGVETSTVTITPSKPKVEIVAPVVEKTGSAINEQKEIKQANNSIALKNNSNQNQKSNTLGVEPKNVAPTPNVIAKDVVNNTTTVAPKKQDEDVAVNTTVIDTKADFIEPKEAVAKTVATKTNDANNNTQFTQTVYKPLDVDNEENNAILVGNMRLNKAKVQNLFKKVGKIFGKSKKAQLDEEEEKAKKAFTTTK